MQPVYQHTQVGYVSLVVIVAVLVGYAWKLRHTASKASTESINEPSNGLPGLRTGSSGATLAVGLLTLTMVMFLSLTVR